MQNWLDFVDNKMSPLNSPQLSLSHSYVKTKYSRSTTGTVQYCRYRQTQKKYCEWQSN